MNENLLPEKDQKAIDIEVVKEQILDLNDKFDYLLFVMMKDKRIQPKDGNYQLKEPLTTSINDEPHSQPAAELEELEVKDAVKTFEQAARKKFGEERKRFRKATPR